MSIRASLQTCKRVAALLVAAAILLAAPYGVAVAVRSGIASIILWNAEIGISGTAIDASAPPPAIGRAGQPDATGPSVAAWANLVPGAHNYNADGEMRLAGNPNTDAFYEPNSFNGPVQDERFREPPLKLSGDADRYNHRDGNDDYRQPGDLFRLMTPEQKDQLFHNVKAAMDGVPLEIVKRQIVHFYRADPDYGIGVATRMGLSVADLPSVSAAAAE